MQRTLLKSKLHRCKVTQSRLDYEGSISIDQNLMSLVDIWEYEKVEVFNITNGNRFSTYAIKSEQNNQICVNGAAAHLAKKGDHIIICAYTSSKNPIKPKIVVINPDTNKPEKEY